MAGVEDVGDEGDDDPFSHETETELFSELSLVRERHCRLYECLHNTHTHTHTHRVNTVPSPHCTYTVRLAMDTGYWSLNIYLACVCRKGKNYLICRNNGKF